MSAPTDGRACRWWSNAARTILAALVLGASVACGGAIADDDAVDVQDAVEAGDEEDRPGDGNWEDGDGLEIRDVRLDR
jgi:hypothetical protein